MREITVESVNGKNVYIFEDHATALVPWAECRRKLNRAPNLLTLDHHTDTMTAFNSYLCLQEHDNPGFFSGETTEGLCSGIDFCDDESLWRAVGKLRNDEQIDAAIRAGIIDYAFVVSYDGRGLRAAGAKPHKRYRIDEEEQSDGIVTMIFTPIEESATDKTPEVPDNKVIVIDWEEGFKYPHVEVTEEDTRRHSDLAIESQYLNAKLKVADEICQVVGQFNFLDGKYILDIDLDYFRTEKSIQPNDPETFYGLIRNAESITVALEPRYVIAERLRGETITSDFLLSRLLEHVRSALK